DRKECLRSCEAAFEQAVARRQLPAGTDTRLAAQGLYAFVTGLMRSWVETPNRFDLGVAAPALIDTFLAGLKAEPPRRSRKSSSAKRAGKTRPRVARGPHRESVRSKD
ncbi:MAG: TetR family transcriptional regulator C-terminal domain-containing protein, partial [Burkholderiales bacterium]